LTIAGAWASRAIFLRSALAILGIQTLSLPPPQAHSKAKPRILPVPHSSQMNRINPKKLLHSKWTAVEPIAKQKHFLVSKIVLPEDPSLPIELIEIEAIYSKKTKQIPWKDLKDNTIWIQGWK